MTEKRIKFETRIPSRIIDIKNVFTSNNFKLYIVGGAVRDMIMGVSPKDWDLATDATPDEVESIMNGDGFRTVGTGEKFGVINVFIDDEEYEIATFRIDSKEGDGRRPDSVTFTTIEEDVKRRDLTINALFYDIDTSEIVDLVGGVSDIKNSVIKTVGDTKERFEEDKLRILRAIRFAGRLDSELDPSIDEVLRQGIDLTEISSERIRDEFLKGIKTSKSVKKYLLLIEKYDLFNYIFKGLDVDKDFIEERDSNILITYMLRKNDVGTIKKTLNKLKYSAVEVRTISFLHSIQKLGDLDLVYNLKKQQKTLSIQNHHIFIFGSLIGLDTNLLVTFIGFELEITSSKIEEMFGIESGPEMGRAIKKMEIKRFKRFLVS